MKLAVPELVIKIVLQVSVAVARLGLGIVGSNAEGLHGLSNREVLGGDAAALARVLISRLLLRLGFIRVLLIRRLTRLRLTRPRNQLLLLLLPLLLLLIDRGPAHTRHHKGNRTIDSGAGEPAAAAAAAEAAAAAAAGLFGQYPGSC